MEAGNMEISLQNNGAQDRTAARHQKSARDSSSCYQTVSNEKEKQALNNPQHQ
jgi:hypothetical protein